MENKVWDILRNLLQQLPSLLTIIGCAVFALSRWKRHPRVSAFAVISLLFLFSHSIIFVFVYALVPSWFMQDQNPQASIRTILNILGLAYNSTLAIGFGLLLTAVFMQRTERRILS